MRRFVISPITQTVPISFSSVRRIAPVTSETVSTFRTASAGNNSPNSHCDFAGLAMLGTMAPVVCGQRFGNALDARRAPCHLINLDHCPLQKNSLAGHIEPSRLV